MRICSREDYAVKIGVERRRIFRVGQRERVTSRCVLRIRLRRRFPFLRLHLRRAKIFYCSVPQELCLLLYGCCMEAVRALVFWKSIKASLARGDYDPAMRTCFASTADQARWSGRIRCVSTPRALQMHCVTGTM